MSDTKRRNRFIIALFIAGMFMGMLVALLFFDIPAANHDIIKVLVGFLGGSFVTMVGYFFGSSDSGPE